MASVSTRIPQPPPRRVQHLAKSSSANHYDAPGTWTREHHAIVHSANAEISESAKLRTSSTKESQKLMRQAHEKQDEVNQKLKKRLKEAKAIRSKLQTTEQQVTAEVKLLVDARRKADDLFNRFANPLNKCNGRIEIRAQRPPGENIEDGPAKAIESQLGAIQGFRVELQQLVAAADAHTLKMQQHLATIRSDVAAKSQAIAIDADCLKLQTSTLDEINEHDAQHAALTSNDADGQHVVIDLRMPELPSASHGGYLVSKSNTHPDLWKQISQYNVDTGRTLANAARDLRMKILTTVKRMHEGHKAQAAQVASSLSTKVKQTSSHASATATEIKKLDAEIHDLEHQHGTVVAAMAAKEVPLELARKRLENRQHRPAKELVRDEVEVTLEQEFDAIVASMKSLQGKEQRIALELRKLRGARAALQRDLDMKQQSLLLDQRCLELDAMSMYSVNTNPHARGAIQQQQQPYSSLRFHHHHQQQQQQQQQQKDDALPPIRASVTPRSNTPRSVSSRRSDAGTPRSFTPRSDR